MRFLLPSLGALVLLSPRIAMWLQPEEQGFRTREAAPGALASLRILRPGASGWGGFAEIEAKTSGWVAGNVHLDPSLSLRVGGSLLIR